MAEACEGTGCAGETDGRIPQLQHDGGARTKQRGRLDRPANGRAGKVQSGHEEADGRHRRSQRVLAGRAEKGAVCVVGAKSWRPNEGGRVAPSIVQSS